MSDVSSPFPRASREVDVDEAIQRSLDGLLAALTLEPVAEDRFRAPSEPARFRQLFGGQVFAQALVAAAATVEGKVPHSLHAYFVEAGNAGEPLELEVERIRDGRSFATRRVAALQDGAQLLVLIASFQTPKPGVERSPAPPDVPPPDSLPTLQDWAARLPEPQRARGRSWIELPPPLDFRLSEPPVFLNGRAATGPRAHWLRVPRDVGDDPLLHHALLAYASDYLLLDIIFRAHPPDTLAEATHGFSLDHSMWLHRPARVDDWLLYVQESDVLGGERGLAHGAFYDTDGCRVATVAQEGLVRLRR